MSEHIYCKNCKYPTIGGAMDGYCNYSNDEDYIESPIYGKLHYVKCEIRNANFDCPYYEFDDGGAEEKNKRESAQKLSVSQQIRHKLKNLRKNLVLPR